jgi:hypothetical protein
MEDFTTAEVGQKLYSLLSGEVEVTGFDPFDDNYKIDVKDRDGYIESYTKDGRYIKRGEVCLFWSKPEIKAPKRKKTFWVAGFFDEGKVIVRGFGMKAHLFETKEEAENGRFTTAFVAPVEMEV